MPDKSLRPCARRPKVASLDRQASHMQYLFEESMVLFFKGQPRNSQASSHTIQSLLLRQLRILVSLGTPQAMAGKTGVYLLDAQICRYPRCVFPLVILSLKLLRLTSPSFLWPYALCRLTRLKYLSLCTHARLLLQSHHPRSIPSLSQTHSRGLQQPKVRRVSTMISILICMILNMTVMRTCLRRWYVVLSLRTRQLSDICDRLPP